MNLNDFITDEDIPIRPGLSFGIYAAVNIPGEELQQRRAEPGGHREHTVAIVCRTDRHCAKTALLLTEEGFAAVQVMRGGMTKWIETAMPVAWSQAQFGGP